MPLKSAARMTCEQVYNIWTTEPDLIEIIDLRSPLNFEANHIPGAVLVSATEIEGRLRKLGGKLAIVITDSKNESDVEEKTKMYSDVVFITDFKRWLQLGYPLSGHSVQNIASSLKEKKLGDFMNDMIFQQLFDQESSTYTYIIADKKSKEAAIIDPVLETMDRDLQFIQELGLRLVYILETHIHADHVTGASGLRSKTKAKIGLSSSIKLDCVDISIEDGQELSLGDKKIRAIATPGHTDSCMSFYFEGCIFTGDTLLIRGTGRTDFQNGSSDQLYESVTKKLFQLPDETKVYPGHDYRGFTSSTIGLEKTFNPRLGSSRSKEEFKKVMSELKLANPKKLEVAVPANLCCGRVKDSRHFHPQVVDSIPVVSPEDVFGKIGKVKIIDVRRPEEFNNELGHISTAQLVTLGPDLTKFLENSDRSEEIVFVCRSGGRSGQATEESIRMGYKFTVNMSGGMLSWNEKSLAKERT